MKNKINIDGILSFFILAAGIYADYIVYTANSLPNAWRYIIMAIVSIITLLLFVLVFKKLSNWATWTRRIFTFIFIVLFVFASINLDKFRIFTNKVTDVKDENMETISIVVKVDSKIEKLDDLKNKTVYYQNGTDKANAKFVVNKLEKEVKGIKFKSENNYFTLAQMLQNEEIDALIISNPYIRSVEDGMEGFESSVKVIQTYQRSVEKINKEHTGANLDLTQDVFTVMVSGMDETGDPNMNSRSDVNMLLIVNPKINHVEMISFPRDSYLPNPALNNVNDKLTHTGNDGVENTMSAI
ncbi:MAG: transporter substrate-binding domain-containing protein, partial [Erysipelotrichia bacterium]|nr:transporter substrate-binding domain-containing protein [Erysipelotrichia bacterium]